MDKSFVLTMYQNNHYWKTGLFSILCLLTFGVFIYPLNEIRYCFLGFSMFLIFLILEFLHYHRITTEIRKNQFVSKRMRVGRMSTIVMKEKEVGIQFEGKIEDKIMIIKYYSINDRLDQIIQNLAKYKYVDMEYYPIGKIVLGFHPTNGDTK